MSHTIQYPVYERERGQSKKLMVAKFYRLSDAINFAFDYSRGRYRNEPEISMIVMDGNRVKCRFVQGAQQ